MSVKLPKLFLFTITLFFLSLFITPNKVQAVINDFCYTKTACWTDRLTSQRECDTIPASTNTHYGGSCSNGTFNPWCESGTDWKFWYPSCDQINFACSKLDWENGECGSTGTTSCTWQQQSCSTTDSCLSPRQPYLNPGLCQPEKWDNIPANAGQACQISPTIYKTCCNADGTLDGNCNGGDYTGTCPAGTTTVQCGFAGKPDCGAAACSTLAPPPPPPPPPPPSPPAACSTPVCIPGTDQFVCTASACNGNYCEETVSRCSSDGCRWDSLPTRCSNDYTYCGTCSAPPPPPPPPTPPPATCTYASSCGTNGCAANQRYVSGEGCPAWYTNPGCYQDQSCSAPPSWPKPPPRVFTCLRVSKTYPTSPPTCDENIAKTLEEQASLTLLPGETAYADLSFKPIGQDLNPGAKAEIFFEEQGVSPSLKEVARYCWNPKWETAGGDRLWLPDLVDPWGNGQIASRGCLNSASWDGIDSNFPCRFANQSWNQDKAFDCADGSKNQRNDSWGTIGGSSERIGADTTLRKSPQKYIQASVTCNGSICGEGNSYKADGSIYRVVIPVQVRSNLTTNTAVKFRAAVVDGWYVNPSGYLGPLVNPTLCGNFEANFTERTPQNGWGGGGGSPFVPAFQACDPWENFEKFTFFSNRVSLSAGPLPPPAQESLTDQCLPPGNQATVGWDAVPGATYYNLRVDNTADGWNGSCKSANGDFCVNNYSPTSYSFTGTPGGSYGWWVHACNNSGCGSPASDENGFKCADPASSPLSVTCSASPNPAPVNTRVRWDAFPVGGTIPYTYDWSGTDSLSGSLSWAYKTYTTTGTKTAVVKVNSADGQTAQSPECSVIVNNNPLPWIYTEGDVHANTRIYTPGGP